MNGKGKFKVIYPEDQKVIQLPTCSNCQKVITGCLCGKPHPRPAA